MTTGLITEIASNTPGGANSSLADEMNLNASRPFNQRIDLSFDDFEDGGDHGDDGMADMDDEELTRDKVKRASSQILLAIDRKKRKPKKKIQGKEIQEEETKGP